MLDTLHPQLGRPGFEIPDLTAATAFEIRTFEEAAALAKFGITLTIAAESVDTIATFWIDPAVCARKLNITASAGCKGAQLVLLGKMGLSGIWAIHSRGSTIIDFGDDYRQNPANIFSHAAQTLFYWGKSSSSNQLTTELQGEGAAILFGEDCMVATEVMLRPSDMHGIFALDSLTVTNASPPPIVINPHVWLGQRAYIGKGVEIGAGSLVAAGSIVVKSMPARSAIAGVPAKVVKSGTTWSRFLVPSREEMERLKAYLDRFV